MNKTLRLFKRIKAKGSELIAFPVDEMLLMFSTTESWSEKRAWIFSCGRTNVQKIKERIKPRNKNMRKERAL